MNRRTALKWLAAVPPVLATGCRTQSDVATTPASTPPAVQPLVVPGVVKETDGREMTPHPLDPTKKIQWLWLRPEGPGPFPAILLVHGHQDGERPGADQWKNMGRVDELVRSGIAVFAVSQPGYGKSDGPPDFCGPFSQEATRAVLAEMRRRAFVDTKRIALLGGSRGAVVAGMVASREPTLAALVLVSGPYDLVREYEAMKAKPSLRKIVDNIEQETGGATNEALRARSVLYAVDGIKAPTLILNGEKDDRTDPEAARVLAEELRARGVDAKAVIYPNAGHKLGRLFADEQRAFLEKHLHPRS